jgi:hypothetical protein
VRVVALVLVVAGSLTIAPPVRSDAASRVFGSPSLGYTLRTPTGWLASIRVPDGAVVVTSLAVPNRNDNPERIRLPRGGVYIWIADWGRVGGDGFPRRPTRIELGEKQVHSCGFGEGYMIRFRDHGQLIQAFVRLGPSTGKGAALAVLNSLRVTH